MDSRLAWIEGELAALEGEGLRRRLTTRQGPQAARLVLDGRPLINFGSNDYLGLAGDPRLAAAAAAALRAEGSGSGASPLVTGHAAAHAPPGDPPGRVRGRPGHPPLPLRFRRQHRHDRRPGRARRRRLLRRGQPRQPLGRLPAARADVRVYPHADCRALDRLLAAAGRYRRKLVATDGLFSMDGDLAPLAELAEVCEPHGAMLLVDEAHATGVFGTARPGVAELAGIEHAHRRPHRHPEQGPGMRPVGSPPAAGCWSNGW